MSAPSSSEGAANGGAKAAIHFHNDAQAASFISKMAAKNTAESRAVHEAESKEYEEYYKRNIAAQAANGAEAPVDDAEQEQKRKAAAPKMTKLYYDLVGQNSHIYIQEMI